MSYLTIRHKNRSRLNENLNFLNYISSLEPEDPQELIPLEVNIMKGLFYVHMYSSIEKAINETVEHTINLINSKQVYKRHFNQSFNTVALFDKLKSFKDCGHKSYFTKAYEIFLEINNSQTSQLNETVFARSLQNVWFNTIEETILCFGVKGFNSTPRIKATINEIVEKRNAVAHGRENASEVGSRFRCSTIRVKFNEISIFINDLIELYETYYNNKDYLKNTAKRLYA